MCRAPAFLRKGYPSIQMNCCTWRVRVLFRMGRKISNVWLFLLFIRLQYVGKLQNIYSHQSLPIGGLLA